MNLTNLNFKWIKIIFINILVFIALLVFIEGMAGVGRIILGKYFRIPIIPLFTVSGLDNPSHPCNEKKTDVTLNLAPNHGDKCFPKAGEAIGEYVVYNANKNAEKVILTLGGSTTSGFYQHLSNGETWPKILADRTKNDFKIYNGGVGAYGSLQELYKVIKDGPRIKNLSYVIRLNGINDTPGFHGYENKRAPLFPFLTENQFRMNESQKWIDSRQRNYIELFIPNLFSLIQRLSRLDSFKEKHNESKELDFKSISSADRWQKNVERINSLVKLEGANYFVFLQPTLGIEGLQSHPLPNSPDAILFEKTDSLFSGNYLNIIRSHYKELKKRCALLSYCIDISNIALPKGNVYNDPRHHNEYGNIIIADKIWDVIKADVNAEKD